MSKTLTLEERAEEIVAAIDKHPAATNALAWGRALEHLRAVEAETVERCRQEENDAGSILAEIANLLVTNGVDLKGTPPMFYPEAIASAIVLARREERERCARIAETWAEVEDRGASNASLVAAGAFRHIASAIRSANK